MPHQAYVVAIPLVVKAMNHLADAAEALAGAATALAPHDRSAAEARTHAGIMKGRARVIQQYASTQLAEQKAEFATWEGTKEWTDEIGLDIKTMTKRLSAIGMSFILAARAHRASHKR